MTSALSDAFFWGLVALAAVALILLAWLVTLELRFQRLARGGIPAAARPLPPPAALADNADPAHRVDVLVTEYQRLATMLQSCIQQIGVVRFNPFEDTGGDQSFVIALLDGRGSGFVLTSLHGRAGTRVYAKPVEHGQAVYALSTEEQEAIRRAQGSG